MVKTIVEVKGIGPASAALLIDAGIKKVEDLAAASVGKVKEVQGFSDIRAARVIAEAKALLAQRVRPEKKKEIKDIQVASTKKKKAGKKKKDKKSEKKKTQKKSSDKKKGNKKNKKKK